MTDRAEKFAMEVVEKTPAKWTCCKCGKTFPRVTPKSPKEQVPWGSKVETIILENGQPFRRIAGDICRECAR